MLASHISGESQYPKCLYVLIETGQSITEVCSECGFGCCRTWRPDGGRMPSRADLELKWPDLFKREPSPIAAPDTQNPTGETK